MLIGPNGPVEDTEGIIKIVVALQKKYLVKRVLLISLWRLSFGTLLKECPLIIT